MAEIPVLIFCAANSRRFSEIAVRHGLKYGAQLPGKVNHPPLYFADQDFKKPNRAKYMTALAEHRPVIASVLDWEREDQYTEVMSWAEEASQYVQEAVIIIPKVKGTIRRIPKQINGKQVRLGYSTPTEYAGTKVGIWEFQGWSVHCLGGSPKAQRWVHNAVGCDSVDGNHLKRLAGNNQFFCPMGFPASNPLYPTLYEAGIVIEGDAPYLAFELPMIAYPLYWQGVDGATIADLQLQFVRDKFGESAITAHMARLF